MTDPLRRELREELAKAIAPFHHADMSPEEIDILDRIEPVIEAELAAARKEERERCAGVVDEIAERHRAASHECWSEGKREASQLASYAARCNDDAAAAIRALEN